MGDYRRLATTIDDAAGEAFDKTAKLLGLGIPGGPRVEALAREGDPRAVPLPRPLVGTSEPHFSFAGLKSAVMRAVQSGQWSAADIAASFQQAVVDCLIDRTARAMAAFGTESAVRIEPGREAGSPPHSSSPAALPRTAPCAVRWRHWQPPMACLSQPRRSGSARTMPR